MDNEVEPQPVRAGPGAVLGERYELSELVGSGGSAEVWRARDTRLGRDVAVKLLSGAAARDPAHRNRIEREARALASLAHPNVVHVYDYGEQAAPEGSPVPYLVMELVPGPDLATRLSTQGPIPAEETVAVLASVLDAVEETHRIGVVHGDIKPANIYLAPMGPKVGDFGVARILAEETGHTVPATTPAYAAPEVLQGERPGPASDVYSAGCVAFEMLSGRPPFEGDSFWGMANQHLNDEPPALQGVAPSVAEAVSRALRKDPADRHPTAAGFAAALRGALDAQEPVPAAPIPAPATVSAPPPADRGLTETLVVTPAQTEVLPPRPPRRTLLAPVLSYVQRIPIGPVIAIVAIALLAAMKGQATSTVPVPELVGVHVDEARAEAARSGFELQVTEVDEGGVAGTVIGQDPPAGTLMSRTSTLTVSVTRGVDQAVMPEVVGKPLAEARAEVEAAGLQVGDVLLRPLNDVTPGTVLETSPPPGTQLDQGSAVQLIVSAGISGGSGSDDDDDDDDKDKDKDRGPPGERGQGGD